MDCYVRAPLGDHVVHIHPCDSAEAALRELSLGTDENFSDLEFSYEAAHAGIVSNSSIINGRGGFQAEDFLLMLTEHPLESVQSPDELLNLLEDYLGSGKDWRVWEGFMACIPPDLSNTFIQRVFLPLLEAGELNSVPDMIRTYLESTGWSKEAIDESFSAEIRDQRLNRQIFLEETGSPPEYIQSANDLSDAIFPTLSEQGAYQALHLVRNFIAAQPTDIEKDYMKLVIAPHMNLFGMQGNADINFELSRFDWHSSDWPSYTGPFTWYGEWD